VLESRHLVGLFLGVVLLCGVFFTLGYVMGKTQYGGTAHAATDNKSLIDAPKPEAPQASQNRKPADSNPPSREWDFYGAGKSSDQLENPAVSSSPGKPAPGVSAWRHTESTPRATTKPISTTPKALTRFQPPRIPKGAVLLQLAALRREGDALALADAIQQKGFPSFVVTPGSDNLYRVQVGPYSDAPAAEKAKQSLAREGFKAIVKR
jgi:DedD protein